MLLNTKTHQKTQGFFLLFTLMLLPACATNKPFILYETPSSEQKMGEKAKLNDVVTLSIPIEIDLVYVDGRKVSFLPPYKKIITYELLAGNHTYGFQYQDSLLNEDGNEETISSQIVVIRFTAKAKSNYIIDFTKPSSFEAALKLEESFNLTLSEQNTNKAKHIIAKSFPAPQSPSNNWLFEALSTNSEEDFNGGNSQEIIEKPAQNANAKTHLHYWWGQASAEERTEFTRWIKR